MKRVFGVKKDKEPPPSIQDATDRISKRGDTVDEKLKKLDAELSRYKEQIKKTRPGPAQEALKSRAMRVLKQKRMYEGQRDMLYNQTFNLDQVSFASEGLKDAQQTMTALKSANKELKGMMKTVKIQDIDNLQDEMMDMMDMSNEIQETLGRSYNVPDDIDEDELMGVTDGTCVDILLCPGGLLSALIASLSEKPYGLVELHLTYILQSVSYYGPFWIAELDALEADMGTEADGVPSYLQPDKEEPDLDAELNLPTAPSGNATAAAGRANSQVEDELGFPAVPRASVRS
ncbi:hypothetical protein Goshw_021434 [Gossypium schwendimanii]|uniref:Charged multivesicular body protein 5 n=1 Tax=Gossypium schwendimanii TaxID=34291 RepID=A0A7J9M7U3_GOSSC|nr:hypothetical protein [Gossypium schwendimanii]